jgi:glycogen debranching enzyme
VACRPQAWTAGASLHVLQAILGLEPNALNGTLDIKRPRLPYWLPDVSVSGLMVGDVRVDLHLRSEQGATAVTSEAGAGLQVLISQ